MKKEISLLLLLMLFATSAFSQQKDKVLITLNGVNAFASKTEILQQFGEPIAITKPDYECGFLSSDEQGEVFYSLEYDGFTWTGNGKRDYVLEELKIGKVDSLLIKFQGELVSQNTSSEKLLEIVGNLEVSVDKSKGGRNEWFKSTLKNKGVEVFCITVPLYDDAYHFYFVDDRLDLIAYWSPY
ncbi:hypothetical protein IFO69_03845 [Echinicola sp. CAU 1574]|uniref:Uncharacterized protein n=1 Tax=Echinicola arenosa TaxID=2774144 RepID=A0ABR9AGL8_9BACT|nr:hypothetical protein [Echinicola arenosa]MBD8487876.1 hypothetical protein [Echinicola arenosa]